MSKMHAQSEKESLITHQRGYNNPEKSSVVLKNLKTLINSMKNIKSS